MGRSAYLHDFICPVPKFQKNQEEIICWLRQAYKSYQVSQTYSEHDYEKILRRVGVSEKQISKRGYYLSDYELSPKHGRIFGDSIAGASARSEVYGEETREIFQELFKTKSLAENLIHVSCTGYRSPSPAQEIAAMKSPQTAVTHSYHMGCYGAFPAVRMAKGFLHSQARDTAVDVVHTELCSLQFQPQDPTLEQILIQTLFADGVAAYRMSFERPEQGFELLAQTEFLIPNSGHAMSWATSESGFAMTLSKDVPSLIATHLRDALEAWEKQDPIFQRTLLKDSLVAVHPGGPKIIDFTRETLELREDQVLHSRSVLKNRGNMSSATVPCIWEQILKDETVKTGTFVVSMAFGPGLTLCLMLSRVIK
jgi:predicted naringenin-chalcone synthase